MSRPTQHQSLEEFKFHSGRLSLDLVATLGSRGLLDIERLRVTTDLARWLQQAGLVGASAQARPSDLRDALTLREAINDALTARHDARLPRGALRVLNHWAAEPCLAPQISADRQPRWKSPRTVHLALSTIARDAITLLSGPSSAKIKQCAGAGCTIFFVDESRSGRRRWCSMNDCGNAAKGAAFVARRRELQERRSKE
jgi:predicted RNA-binding Zn ribbon-like protein